MLNYSIALRANPRVPDAPKKAYANAQYSDVMTLDEFAEHISTHGSVYSRADIAAVLTLAVDCMREQLLAGQKVQLGDLGSFYLNIHSAGADKASDFNPATHVKDVKVRWSNGRMLRGLLPEVVFNLVPTRRAAQKVVKALKAGDSTVELAEPKTDDGELVG